MRKLYCKIIMIFILSTCDWTKSITPLCAFNDKSPAITSTNHGEFLRYYLTNIHKARKAFIMYENSAKIHRAMWHNIRTSNDNIFVSSDSVYYKCICGRHCRGPAAVLVKEGWKFKKLRKFEITGSLDSKVEFCNNWRKKSGWLHDISDL